MSIRRVVPNVRARRGADNRAFYVDVLGLRVVMEMDFIVTFASPSNPMAQVSVVNADPARPHPDLTIEVADVDAAYTRARERGGSRSSIRSQTSRGASGASTRGSRTARWSMS